MPKNTDQPREPSQMVQFKLRFRERTRARLESAAKAAGTSLNSEIVSRLEASLRGDLAMRIQAELQQDRDRAVSELVFALNALVFSDGPRCWEAMSPLQRAFCHLAGALEVAPSLRRKEKFESTFPEKFEQSAPEKFEPTSPAFNRR